MHSIRLTTKTTRALQSFGCTPNGPPLRPAAVSRSSHTHLKAQARGHGQGYLSSLDQCTRRFSSTPNRSASKNRIYTSIRDHDQFQTYLQLSSSSRRPLLTLWTTSWCPTCRIVSPLLKELVESGTGAAEGGVTYAEVEFDAPDVMAAGLGLTYMITSVPTLLSFDAGEAQVETKVADGNKLRDKNFLEEWIRTEARRHGGRGGGGGGSGGASLFGGLFGSFRG